jgi:hypothetical protein
VAQLAAVWLLLTALPISSHVVFHLLPHTTVSLKKSFILIFNSLHDRAKYCGGIQVYTYLFHLKIWGKRSSAHLPGTLGVKSSSICGSPALRLISLFPNWVGDSFYLRHQRCFTLKSCIQIFVHSNTKLAYYIHITRKIQTINWPKGATSFLFFLAR